MFQCQVGDTMPSKEDTELPELWQWDADWSVDFDRAVDPQGW